jgi:hypothetical protein
MPLLLRSQLFGEIGLEQTVDVALDVARVREAARADKRMRADAEALVLLAPPVAKVVAALLAFARKVADLVLLQSRRAEPVDRFYIRRRDQLIVG